MKNVWETEIYIYFFQKDMECYKSITKELRKLNSFVLETRVCEINDKLKFLFEWWKTIYIDIQRKQRKSFIKQNEFIFWLFYRKQ